MIAGGNWWRANVIVIRHLTRQTATRYRCRDRASEGPLLPILGLRRRHAAALRLRKTPSVAQTDGRVVQPELPNWISSPRSPPLIREGTWSTFVAKANSEYEDCLM